LEPWRKQSLRLLIGLEHRLQQSGEALSGLEMQSYQSARLDRKEATSNLNCLAQ
jgi:hypothetical protein